MTILSYAAEIRSGVIHPKQFARRVTHWFRSAPFYVVAGLLHGLFLLIFATCHVMGYIPDIATQFTAPPASKPEEQRPLPPPPPSNSQKLLSRNDRPLVIKPPMIAVSVPNPMTTIPRVEPLRMVTKDLSKLPKTARTSGAAYVSRLGVGARASAITKYGGNAQRDELAVVKALHWLRDSQNLDGSWGAEYKPSMTGLALLAFQAHGETHLSGEYAGTLQKGIQYLLEQGKANKNQLSRRTVAYEHAIAAYALADAYGLTQDSDLLGVLPGAIARIIKGQNTRGSWNYTYDPVGENDLSAAGWNIQALKAAKSAGLSVEGLDESMARALVYVKSDYDSKSGRFGYNEKGKDETDALVGVGLLSMEFLGAGKSKELAESFHTARLIKCNWSAARAEDSYTWYYLTQAMFMSGGENWQVWHKEFSEEVLKHQRLDGHWPVPGTDSDLPGGWVKSPKDSPIYHTTLFCMMLEVYYRFSPIFKNA